MPSARGASLAAVTSVVLAALFFSYLVVAGPVPVREVGGEERQRPRNGPAPANSPPPSGGGVRGGDTPKGREGVPWITPWHAASWAWGDIQNLPADVYAHDVRYLSLYNFPPGERIDAWKDISFAVNSLSRRREMVIPALIPGTENSLVRIDLHDYDIDPKQWDRLARLGSGRVPVPEPYFRQKFKNISPKTSAPAPPPGGGGRAGWRVQEFHKEDPPGTFWYDERGKPVMVKWLVKDPSYKPPASGPAPIPRGEEGYDAAAWVTRGDVNADIRKLVIAAKTEYPILRGDWFVTYSLWAPRYYELLGLGNKLEDFHKLVRVREKEDADRKVGGVVVQSPRRSRVVLNNRFIVFLPSTNLSYGATYWETHDSKKSTDERQYLNVLLDFLKFERGLLKEKKKADDFFDATEDIGNLANGLQAYFLTNGKEERLDKADSDIATDRTSSYQDTQVWCARNCITCHVEGIRPMQEAVRGFSRGKIGLLVVDDDKERTNSRLIKDFFAHDMDGLVKRACDTYEAAVGAATKGRSASQNAASFMRLTAGYLDDGITLEKAAWEVGMPAPRLKALLSRAVGVDPTLTGLLGDNPEEIRRDQWEVTSFPQLMLFLETQREIKPGGGDRPAEPR